MNEKKAYIGHNLTFLDVNASGSLLKASFTPNVTVTTVPVTLPAENVQVEGKIVDGFNLHTLMSLNLVTPVIETFKYSSSAS